MILLKNWIEQALDELRAAGALKPLVPTRSIRPQADLDYQRDYAEEQDGDWTR